MAEVFRVLAEKKVLKPENAENLVRVLGFRNTAVHAYQKIDGDIVHAIATRHLDDFRVFVRSVLKYLDSQERWRREDCRQTTPDERVQALFEARCARFPEEMQRIKRCATVRAIGGRSTQEANRAKDLLDIDELRKITEDNN